MSTQPSAVGSTQAAAAGHHAATAAPTELVVLGKRRPHGTARLLATVLAEKVQESPWKAETLRSVATGCVSVHTTDRGEHAYIDQLNGQVIVRSEQCSPPKVVIRLDSALIPKVLRLKEGPLRLPVLWDAPGRFIARCLLHRTIRVNGLFRHPVLSIKALQVLSCPSSR